MQNVKTSRLLAIILTIAMIFSVIPVSGLAEETEKEYIEIRTIEELYNVRNNLSANYILMNDIDLSKATAQGGDWDFMGNGWNPIGSNDIYSNGAFSGVFDGNGHKITGLRIKTSNLPSGTGTVYAGLFAYVTGTVKNLTIDGDIWNTYGSGCAGGITAYLTGTIENCFNNANIRGYLGAEVGGLAGYASGKAKVYNCANMGNITVTAASSYKYDQCAGGIVGKVYSESVTISKCYNTGKISAMSSTYSGYGAYAAGISNGGKIDNCYNAGEVEAINSTDSTYGYTYAYGIGGTATNCYNVGMVTGSSCRYAISDKTSTKCYYLTGTGNTSTGATVLTESQMLLSSLYSGFDFENVWVQNTSAVYPYPQLIDNVQDLRVIKSVELFSTPDKIEYAYGESLNLSGAKLKITLADGKTEEIAVTKDMVSGFDSKKPGPQTITVIYKGRVNTFDVVVNQKIYKEIRTLEELYNIRMDLSANYMLMNDIDLTEATATGGDWDFMGNGWNPIGSNDIYGNSAFSGEFDGNGHKITGIRIKTSTTPSGTGTVYAGLFAKVTGTVKNLTIYGDIWNTYSGGYAGSITAYLEGTIENCFNNANVKGYYGSKTGGLAGYAGSNAKVYNCANTGDITVTCSSGDQGKQYAGGIVGSAADATTISKCYNTGKILAMSSYINSSYKGSAYSAGIANGGKIDNCYNVGEVEAIKYSASSTYGYTYAYGIGGTATNCYNVGTVTGENSRYAISDLTSTNCYYLTGTGTTSTGATALTESQMRLQTMYVGFDFDNVWTLNNLANHPYPQLLSNVQDLEESASLVSIVSLPLKTEYMVGEALVLDGCVMDVTYVSGHKKTINVTSDMISGYDKTTPGVQVVTVSYRGSSDTFTVTVKAMPEVTSVELVSAPDTTEFRIGTAFDFTGAKIKVKYNDGTTETLDVTYDMTTGGNINHLGKQTITVAFGGKSVSFEVTVTAISVSKLKFGAKPEKLTYLEGQDLDLSGMILIAVMNTGEEKTVSAGYNVKGYSSKPGTHKVTIEYMSKTIDFEVVVNAKTVVELTLKATPNKTSYYSGEPFDPTGLMVVAKYDNGDIEVVEDYILSGFSSVPGLKTVTVKYGGKYVAFPVTVIDRVITEFKITSYPAKLEYIQYESFDSTGLEVKATYNDGKVEEIKDYTLIGFSSNIGVHTISVAYEGWVETFEVEVLPRMLTNLVVKAPQKLTYFIGETFDTTGMTVTACYNNGQQVILNDYTVSGFDSTEPGIKTITITYGESSSVFSVLVNDRNYVDANGSFAVGSIASHIGDTITVPVTIFNNTGIAGFTHKITFNANDLEFKSLEIAEGYEGGTLIINDQKAAEGEITILWFNTMDVSDCGEIYNLSFVVRETANDGDSEISLSFNEDDHGNIAGENVIFSVANGTVNIRSYWQGDVDGDRVIGMVDLLQLAQYIAGIKTDLTEKQLLSADVNEDGKINIHDIIMLQQWLLVSEMSTGSVSLLSADNEEAIEFSFGEAMGAADDEVVIPVVIKNNPGLATYRFRVTYDKNALAFVSASSGDVTKKGSFSSIAHSEEGMMTFLWYSTTEVSGDGEIAFLRFKVLGEVAGSYPINVTSLSEDVVNAEGKMLSYEVSEGRIVVVNKNRVTNTTLSDDGKMITVNATNVRNNEKVILALYNDDKFVEVQFGKYVGESIEFTTEQEYTQAIVMIWDSTKPLSPICDMEEVTVSE